MPSDIVNNDALERQLFGVGHGPLSGIEQRLANSMNTMLYARMQPIEDGFGASTRRQLEYIRSRAELETMYPGMFRGGAGIEFSDDFRVLSEVASIFPPGFDGIVDLTICNSLALGEKIRQRCTRALAIATGEPIQPILRLPLLLAIMQFLKRHPGSFDGAMKKMQDQFGRYE